MPDSTRYSFAQDNDGHWFQIPCTLRNLFSRLLDGGDDTEKEFIDTFEKYMVGGGIEDITFLEPKKLPRGIPSE